MSAREKFNRWVDEELKRPRATRVSIAARLGVSPSVLTKLRKDPNRSVSLDLAVAIEREAGIPVEAWVSGEAA